MVDYIPIKIIIYSISIRLHYFLSSTSKQVKQQDTLRVLPEYVRFRMKSFMTNIKLTDNRPLRIHAESEFSDWGEELTTALMTVVTVQLE